ALDRYMHNTTTTWYPKHYGKPPEKPIIAYFSTEFGLAECLRNYSGGLGVLFQEGYFSQYLNADGYQQEAYPVNDYANQPVIRVVDEQHKPILVSVPLADHTLYAQIWRVQVGRVPLYLLDTNIPENTLPEDRDLTDRLY